MIGVIDRVRLGAFDLNMSIIDPVFIVKQCRQGAMDPKQLGVPVESGRDPEGRLVVTDRHPRTNNPFDHVVASETSSRPRGRRLSEYAGCEIKWLGSLIIEAADLV